MGTLNRSDEVGRWVPSNWGSNRKEKRTVELSNDECGQGHPSCFGAITDSRANKASPQQLTPAR